MKTATRAVYWVKGIKKQGKRHPYGLGARRSGSVLCYTPVCAALGLGQEAYLGIEVVIEETRISTLRSSSACFQLTAAF